MILNFPPTSMIDLSRNENGHTYTAAFLSDVTAGLSQEQKKLSSRYFYDATGSRLFQQIMNLPEYYLTRCEHELLNRHRQTMAAQFAAPGFFHLVDLGAGDALKTKILLGELHQQQHNFEYVPIDISGDAMQQLNDSLQQELPAVEVQAVVGEYLQALDWLQENKPARKVVLFLGSNIGNFEPAEGIAFLKSIRSSLRKGDMLLLGVDLRKDPGTILRAYDDAAGVTAAFNLNLLHRINRELGGNFEVDKFRHYALYNPQEGVMQSFLISQEEQQVYLEAAGKEFHFQAYEAIHTESSHKYTLQQVKEIGQSCGFRTKHVYLDQQGYFADVLFSAA